MAQQKVCIIGGGATGVALMWCLAQDAQASQEWAVTLIHNQGQLGGHSLADQVSYNGKTYPVDIGVQFISPMLYPNVKVMLERPEFQQRVPVTNFDSLKVACAFPRDANGNPQNWGNFPEYQEGPGFALFSPDVQYDAGMFQAFIETALFMGWGGKTLAQYFANPPQPYRNQQQFVDYFLWPYLSIMNGYGAALMNQTTFGDLIPLFAKIPLFPSPLGGFIQPGTGWQRFTYGASSWVQAMADVAALTTTPNIYLNSTATAVWTDQDAVVHVQWQDSNGNSTQDTFDKVVLTTDMWTNAQLLNNANNQTYWPSVYQNTISQSLWQLMWGQCYIHTDPTLLSPDLTQQLETLQFNAYYAPSPSYPFYDLSKTFTTYMQKNLLNDPAADGLYLTMYGYVPDPAQDKVPDPSTVLFQEKWTHGMWAPSFMGGIKQQLHTAQGLGSISYPGQANTNVYFAGNNTTSDSEEGALDSAMIIANYAFGVPYPLGINPLAFGMYYIFYHEVMFPGQDASSRLAMLPRLFTV